MSGDNTYSTHGGSCWRAAISRNSSIDNNNSIPMND